MPLPGTSFNIDSEFLTTQEGSSVRETGSRKQRGKGYGKKQFLVFSIMFFAFDLKFFS